MAKKHRKHKKHDGPVQREMSESVNIGGEGEANYPGLPSNASSQEELTKIGTAHQLLYDSYTPQEKKQIAVATHWMLNHSDLGDHKRLTGHKCVFRFLVMAQWMLLVYGFACLGFCAYFVLNAMGEFLVIGGAILSGLLLFLAFLGFWPATEYSRKGIYIYTTLLFLVIGGEIAVVVLSFLTDYVETYSTLIWKEADINSRDNIETFLTCCGFNDGYTDSVSDACTNGGDKTRPACYEALRNFMTGNPIFMTVMGLVILTEIVALVSACLFGRHLRKSVRYTSSEKYKSQDANLEGVLTHVHTHKVKAPKPPTPGS